MRFISAFALSALAAGVGIAAQSRDPIRVSTRLVQVHVIVQDDDRNPVRDLTAKDFRLTEDGKDQTLALFEVDSGQPTGTAATQLTPLSGSTVFANATATDGSVTAILIDRLNTGLVDQLGVRNQAIAFLEQLRPTDRVGVYMLDNADVIHVLHDFSSDTRSLMRAVARIKGRTSNELGAAADALDTSTVDAMISPALLAWVQGVEQNREVEETRDRVRHTNVGLETLARRLAGVRGRKNLLWISSAFPISVANSSGISTSLAPELNSGLHALNDANVAVYPIDARRLIGAFATPASARMQTFTTLGNTGPSFDTLHLVAEETGGRAFINSNDITGAMRRAIDDGRVTYVLGYYPSHNAWNNRFRQIKVHVNRRGVNVRHRRGYRASPAPAGDERSRDAELKAALQSPLPSTAIGLEAQIVRPDGQAPGTITAIIRIDPRGLDLQKTGERWSGVLDLIAAQATAQGAMSVAVFTTLTLDLTAEQHAKATRDGLVLSRSFVLTDATHQLRIVARDVRTGATGSLIVASDSLRAVTRR